MILRLAGWESRGYALVMRLFQTVVCCLLFCTGWLGAGEWARFRGPEGNGIYQGAELPLKWGPNLNVGWRAPLPGEGWSSPVVGGGRVYLTAAVPEGAKDYTLRVFCLDANQGGVVWNVELFRETGAKSPNIHKKNSHASPTPILRDGRLYVHFGHMGTACLDLNGKLLWKREDLSYKPVHGNGGSPILHDGRLIFSVDGAQQRFVLALDASTGKDLWRHQRTVPFQRKFSFSTPALIRDGNRDLVLSPGSGVMSALDVRDGREAWYVTYDGYSVIPKPLLSEGLVILGTGYDRPKILAVRPGGKGDVTATHVAWSEFRGAPNTPSPLVKDGLLYLVADRGMLTCLEVLTGKQVYQERLPGNYSASPILDGEHLYCTSEEGVTHVVRTGRQFEILASNDLEERTLASLAPVDGTIYLRTAEALYRIHRP